MNVIIVNKKYFGTAQCSPGSNVAGYLFYPWGYRQSWLISLKPSIPTHSVVSMQMGVTWIGSSLEVVYVKAAW